MVKTRSELVAEIKTTTRETQIDTYIKEYLNFTLQEINDPAWAYEQQGLRSYNHLWSFNRRKNTIAVTAENAQLPRDCDKISLIRQIESPTKLKYLPDDIFYRLEPNPTATGNPLFYRIWEEEGVSVRLSTDDMLEVLSDNTADTTQTVRIFGYDTNGLPRTESLTLSGTTAVAGTITYDAGKPLRISKSADTTGIISIREKTADTVLVKLAPTERMARFKIISLYPLPTTSSGVITAVSDYSGTVTGKVKITDASHGLSTGNTITIAGTTDYNGDFSITKIDDDNFYITETYTSSQTGTWTSHLDLYLEYFTRIRLLEGDNDVPDIDEKWIWVLRLGTMAKVYQYQGKLELFTATQNMYASGVRSMVRADMQEPDYIPMFASHHRRLGVVTFDDTGYGSYGLI